MLGMIGNFKFQMNKTQFDTISHEVNYDWSESKRIGNHAKLQAVGKSNESFTFSGTLILKKVDSFNNLIEIGNKQEPVVLSFVNATSINVVIVNIKRDMSIFLKSGEFIKQGFTITLKRWYS
ncbi:phage tail protein [Sulfurimonas sp.]|uniref:phage tail protein n=1 Tax=Sulfurimonas sp. TaxID=2022749 RepID=UPI0025EC839F|nr:phage tail protein [Sulfurimonas sp.]